MTPRQAREARTRLEIARGREVADRYERKATLDAWEGKALINVEHHGNIIEVTCGPMLFVERAEKFPSVDMVARIALAVEAGEHNMKYGGRISDLTRRWLSKYPYRISRRIAIDDAAMQYLSAEIERTSDG